MKLHCKRPGFTLVEVLVFVSVGSVIFFMAIQLIHLSMSISRTANERWEQDAVLSRLSREFRRDMQQATSLELVSTTQLQVDLGNDRSIHWSLTNQRLRRTSRLGQQPAIEDFQLGDYYQAKLEYEPSTKLIRLRVSRNNDAGELTSRIERLVECHTSSDVKLVIQRESSPTNSAEDQP